MLTPWRSQITGARVSQARTGRPVNQLLVVMLPIVLAAIIAIIRYFARSVSPGSAFNFALGRLTLYAYLAGGGLILFGWFAASRRPVPANTDILLLLLAGWAAGLVILLAGWWLGQRR